MRTIILSSNELNQLLDIFDSNLSVKDKCEQAYQLYDYDTIMNIKIKDFSYIQHYKFKIIRQKYKEFNEIGCFSTSCNYYQIDSFKNINSKYEITDVELRKRLDDLKVLYDIINSDKTDSEKAYILFNTCKSASQFQRTYSKIVRYGEKDEKLSSYKYLFGSYKELLEKYREYEKNKVLVNNVKYRYYMEEIVNKNNYLDNYLYAEYIIKTYIEDSYSYKHENFLKKFGINEQIFQYCTELIKFVNPELYKDFKIKNDDNILRSYEAINATFVLLADAINKGVFNDGTSFNILEFYKRVPFKSSGNDFFDHVKDYLNKYFNWDNPVSKTIMVYIKKNDIRTIKYVSKESVNDRNKTIRGIEITPDINDIIFKYLYAYQLPSVSRVYDIVLDMYLNNQIDLAQLEKKKIERDEIINNSKINNPYTLKMI